MEEGEGDEGKRVTLRDVVLDGSMSCDRSLPGEAIETGHVSVKLFAIKRLRNCTYMICVGVETSISYDGFR